MLDKFSRYKHMSVRKLYEEYKKYQIPEHYEDIINTTLMESKYINPTSFLKRKIVHLKELKEYGVL